MKKLSGFFFRISTGWITLAALLIFLLFAVLTLPAQNKLTASYDQGLGSPDTSFVYSSQTLFTMAEAYGTAGRASFIKSHWSFDLAFPIIYTFFFLSLTSYLIKKNITTNAKVSFLNLAPLATMIFDLSENATTSAVMAAFPLHNVLAESLAPFFTPLKWFFFIFCVLQVLVYLLLWIVKGLFRR